MSGQLRIWAVDVSKFTLWESGSKGEASIESYLANSVVEQARVKRYLREIDQIRSLAGKLLVRLALIELGHDIDWHSLSFQKTREGRPYLFSPSLDFDFNITHDGDWVAIVFLGSLMPQSIPLSAPRVGVDVMEVHLPKFESSVLSFVDTMDMTMTTRERLWILSNSTHDLFETHNKRPDSLDRDEYNQLKKLYTLWTYKEAFTKAKGLGLGYDFQTIEIIKEGDRVSITTANKPEKGIEIYQIVLPADQGADRKAGGGTGLSSLLVAMQLTQDEPIRLKTFEVEKAQQQGLLRMWTMSNLVVASKAAMSKG